MRAGTYILLDKSNVGLKFALVATDIVLFRIALTPQYHDTYRKSYRFELNLGITYRDTYRDHRIVSDRAKRVSLHFYFLQSDSLG